MTAYLFFVFWFGIGMAFHMQLFPLDFTVSDRWFYFPMGGLLGIIAVLFELLRKEYKKIVPVGYVCAIFIICLLSIRTIVRNTNWQNQLTLFAHDISLQDNFDSENNLGSAYTRTGDTKSALKHYRKSVEFLPNDTNLFNLGYSYEVLGDIPAAKKYYLKVIANKSSRSADKLYSFETLGFLYSKNDPKIAKNYAVEGLREFPDSGSLYAILAMSEYDLHDRSAALNAAERAKLFLPDEETNMLYFLIQENKPVNSDTLE